MFWKKCPPPLFTVAICYIISRFGMLYVHVYIYVYTVYNGSSKFTSLLSLTYSLCLQPESGTDRLSTAWRYGPHQKCIFDYRYSEQTPLFDYITPPVFSVDCIDQSTLYMISRPGPYLERVNNNGPSECLVQPLITQRTFDLSSKSFTYSGQLHVCPLASPPPTPQKIVDHRCNQFTGKSPENHHSAP